MQNRNMRPDHKGGRGHHGGGRDGNPDHNRGERHNRRDHHERGQHGGGRGRAKRGEARYILLDVLQDGPKHGYEIIKTLEERSGGQYIPSPGTVYPTLQYLEDQGLVRADQETERRVYQLTEAGQAELAAQAAPIAIFWSRFAAQTTTTGQPEMGFLEDELEHLNRIVWSGLGDAIVQDDQAQIRRVRQVIEACQTQVRAVITTPGES